MENKSVPLSTFLKLLLRIFAGIVGVSLPLLLFGGALLFQLFTEPDRPLSTAMLAISGGFGLLLGIGFLAFAFVPHKIFAHHKALRITCIVSLLIPFLAGLYFSFVAGPAPAVAWFGVGLLAACCAEVLRREG